MRKATIYYQDKKAGWLSEDENGFHLTVLVNPKDDEDLALNLNGKKKKLKRKDFESAFDNSKLDAKQQANIFQKMEKAKPSWFECIQSSFLSPNFKNQYIQLIEDRFARLSV